ncbi:hypothetical protein BBO99_00003873 [Phytophthora kernoviae]|uniref:Protein kinase domain-containing protein n=2 Tax=Phytophthora kernoviae TaxID=325452 RepID=A0A3R7J8J6_9STRA|nr:hypothetical protein G195_004436 [Phytophthora kernoviae 00238/432]KAG2526669.1 hypothetical protein JM16_003574 [Phytophthora kernoviae]KAG2528341.1 hypothetical protein JM18_003280 [Phytophthora kernoviae]RLN37381.1 hypothetical protein BBI17_004002 [Phytophthora kernoviae]RLN81249.1 hypothetical protein BBO99_00003873 [Phytophthora kernoviae]
MGYGYPASGACVGAYDKSYYVIASLNANGSASLQYSSERSCLSDSLYRTDMADKITLEKHVCASHAYKWYSSNDAESANGRAFALAITVLVAIVIYKRRSKFLATSQLKETLRTDSIALLETPVLGQTGLWDDDVITANRVPRDKVIRQQLISRGAFGEVYSGVFNGQQVAIKMLLPATRGNLKHVNDFLGEAKLHATMDHPHIVTFMGVAWDSLSDLCVLLEYMDSGELRTLLNTYEKEKYPIGYNRQKTTIALQVAHALTYLHSLVPPVIHRDLKSRNILFNSDMDAKLSDFGISRERLDSTMTAGVGTSLWMAPEVMMGERYDDKADMFSFGVVMSELDVHSLPYARVKRENLESSGRTMADSVLLQRVAHGTAKAEFSDASPQEVIDLGRACMQVDPTQRPTAAEALYKLHVILKKMP